MTRVRPLFVGLVLLFAAQNAWSQQPAEPAPAPLPPTAPPPATPPAAAPVTPLPRSPSDATAPLAPPVEAAPVVPSAPPPLVEPVPTPVGVAPEPAAPPAPDKLSIGKTPGFFQPSALIQFWALYQDNTSNVSSDPTTTFRLRRAEFRAKGEIIPKLLGYNLMIDASKLRQFNSQNVKVQGQDPAPTTAGTVAVPTPSGDNTVLQDVFITFISDYADVSVGQFKIQISYEGFNSASKLLFPERSLVAMKFGDRRDIGVRIEKKLGDYFFYSLGVFNGTGQNRFDDDNEKDAGLRLEVYPIKPLTLGAVGYTTVGKRDQSTRDRVEGDVKLDISGVLLQGEYIHGWDKAGAGQTRIEAHGAYGALGYTFLDRIQPMVRIGFLDSNIDASGDRVTTYEGEVNYFVKGPEARLALAFSAFDAQTSAPTAYTGTLLVQASY